MPIKIVEKVSQKEKRTNKRMNDEYQLSNAKVVGHKVRSHSTSSADLSCSIKSSGKAKLGSSKSKKVLNKK